MSGTSEPPEVPAGDLVAWLAEVRAALAGAGDADVPCGTCTACCTSSQFVHIAPDERDALAHIPAELVFPAPGLPRGHVLLGYDERGRCPMLGERGCSIYEHRPRTCRVYDCRVLAATGTRTDEPSKSAIDARAAQWRFDVDGPRATAALAAVRAASTFLRDHRAELDLPEVATPLAVAAVALHDVFLDAAGTSVVEPPVDLVAAELRRRRS